MSYVGLGYVEPNYTEGDNSSSTVSCDLTVVTEKLNNIDASVINIYDRLDYLNTRFANLTNSINSLVSTVSSLASKEDLLNLATKEDLTHIVLNSLNGVGSEYKDGTLVKVSGRDTVYAVERSFHSLYSDNGYTVHYDLVSVDGYRVTVPEALLTKQA
ncbi:MAG TPA: hypothetical protein VLZ29_03450 [Sulfurimonas sp.]|uniref:hypothetical protein n=1 Tax=Sulfurimonas sp. TaxID=2022749 RepID=UPI002C9ECBCB|nr:hypothetical protein [Sulfurimonas sp.]HUH42148.1 hypothetical protein [Sulfurimonas sp.]